MRRPDVLARIGSLLLLAAFTAGAVLRAGHPGQVALLDVGVYNAVYLAAVVSCLRPCTAVPGMRTAWRLVAVALATGAVANLTYSAAADGAPASGAALSDALYLASYPASSLAVVAAVRSRVRRFPPSLWWDGAVTGLGAAAVLLSLPAARQVLATGPGQDRLAVVYPVADLVQLALLAAAVVLLRGKGGRALVTAGLGMAVLAAGDVLYLAQQLRGGYVEGGLADVVDLAGVVLLGIAAGSPDRPAPRRQPGPELSWPVLAPPSAAAACCVALLAVPGWGGPPARGLATACLLAAVVRMVLTLGEVRGPAGARRDVRTDELTGLPDRHAFAADGDPVVAAATAAAPVALLVVDVDRLRHVNDALGRAAGDELLVRLAARLRHALPRDAVVARLAGDGFAALVPGTDRHAALGLAAGLHRAMGRDLVPDGLPARVGTSIGVACAPDAAATGPELLRCAEVAMYRAKAAGGGWQAYRPATAVGAPGLLRTAAELRRVLDGDPAAGTLVVHLQPQVRLRTGEPVGMEALVRWDHPVRGLLGPQHFLTAARTAGLLGGVTARVLDLALAAARRCRDAGRPLPVSVNVSAAGLHDGELPARVAAALHRHGLPPSALLLELTEETLMTRPDPARDVLAELHDLGVRISIDDYGTGYSSLAYLRRLPVDELKLDRALLQGLPADRAAAAIVRYTAELAATLGIRLVVEGVEDEATRQRVTALGADVAQGFHLARPMPADDLLRWLLARAPVAAGGADPVGAVH